MDYFPDSFLTKWKYMDLESGLLLLLHSAQKQVRWKEGGPVKDSSLGFFTSYSTQMCRSRADGCSPPCSVLDLIAALQPHRMVHCMLRPVKHAKRSPSHY